MRSKNIDAFAVIGDEFFKIQMTAGSHKTASIIEENQMKGLLSEPRLESSFQLEWAIAATATGANAVSDKSSSESQRSGLDSSV